MSRLGGLRVLALPRNGFAGRPMGALAGATSLGLLEKLALEGNLLRREVGCPPSPRLAPHPRSHPAARSLIFLRWQAW
jgi:hypothetical protein